MLTKSLNTLFHKELSTFIQKVLVQGVSIERKKVLLSLINFIKDKLDSKEEVNLNFICTHNSRRSQFSQLWAYAAAHYYGVKVDCFSGGVEVTAFNERAVESLKRSGFKIEKVGKGNPVYSIYISKEVEPLNMFSKLFDDEINKVNSFAAVMTCSHADDNCPHIVGAEQRISVRYNDPKEFDDTPLESEKYDERSLQIASEFFYVFREVMKSRV